MKWLWSKPSISTVKVFPTNFHNFDLRFPMKFHSNLSTWNGPFRFSCDASGSTDTHTRFRNKRNPSKLVNRISLTILRQSNMIWFYPIEIRIYLLWLHFTPHTDTEPSELDNRSERQEMWSEWATVDFHANFVYTTYSINGFHASYSGLYGEENPARGFVLKWKNFLTLTYMTNGHALASLSLLHATATKQTQMARADSINGSSPTTTFDKMF